MSNVNYNSYRQWRKREKRERRNAKRAQHIIQNVAPFAHQSWIDSLLYRCQQSTRDIVNELSANGAQVTDTRDGPIVHLERGAKVLAVAHMDYVNVNDNVHVDNSRRFVSTSRLDDRLGVWILLDVLPALGIAVDLLLTDSEEIGCSTAREFDTSTKYNWLVQFDRRGTDVVTYDYDSAAWIEALRSVGFDYSWGTFSDISYLEHLGACGVNIGIAYYNEHTKRCYCDLSQTAAQLQLFRLFYDRYANVHFNHVPFDSHTWYDNSRSASTSTWYDSKTDALIWDSEYLAKREYDSLPFYQICKECGDGLDTVDDELCARCKALYGVSENY